ncbi:DUF262 domain-containing protein [Paenibacillus alginolyticus]|uniref:DUF262 domain-containing protein n=1 Tax=Paenibacillus alginolyticus TaxID=59839 RepID=UPI000422E073|nr:DUF262 domain-containing protein [Paenibacillus alginolyticus]MCY9669053.1 DUF262 domain-containing protein [Paenibacillus alginolyticus]
MDSDYSNLSELTKIVSYNISNTVSVLNMQMNEKEIDLSPEFQRQFVWDMKRASLFIDSLLIGLPVPSIILGKSKESEYFVVIDGQQRLKTIYYYLKGFFFQNNNESVFRLKNLEGRSWNNLTFEELEDVHKRRLRNAVISTTIIEDIDTRPDVVHDLFHRLNTGGMPLTDQEVRNCFYAGEFVHLLNDLNNDNQKWKILIGKPNGDKRLRDVEMLLRYFALLFNSENYTSPMRNFLSDFLGNHQNDKEFLRKITDIFNETVEIIYNEIGFNAFKKYNRINKSICDSLMVAVSKVIMNKGNFGNIRNNYLRLLEDDGYTLNIIERTSTDINVRSRLYLAEKYIAGEEK